MESIIITVKRSDESSEYDLAVQTDVPLAQLSDFITEGLNWNSEGWNFEIKIEHAEQSLLPEETLNDAGVLDGAKLIFLPEKLHGKDDESQPPDLINETPDTGKRRKIWSDRKDSPGEVNNEPVTGYGFTQID